MIRRRTLLEEQNGDFSPINDYLTFIAIDECRFSLTLQTIGEVTPIYDELYYSLDGNSWTNITSQPNTPIIRPGKKICFKGRIKNIRERTDVEPYYENSLVRTWTMYSGGGYEGRKFAASGNPMSLLFLDDFRNRYDFYDEIRGETLLFAFSSLFKDCAELVDISLLSLPATDLIGGCYENMFEGCTGLTELPSGLLPAERVITDESAGWFCAPYQFMFAGCTGLTELPNNLISAVYLDTDCFMEMFRDCTGLTTLPSDLLPATTFLFAMPLCSMVVQG